MGEQWIRISPKCQLSILGGLIAATCRQTTAAVCRVAFEICDCIADNEIIYFARLR